MSSVTSPLTLVGHHQVLNRFETALSRGRMGSSFLFTGPPGIGKRKTAQHIAQSLLCSNRTESKLEACQTCPPCQQVVAGTHPDFHVIEKPADKSGIPIDLLIGDREHRMREGLCHEIAMKPMAGSRKIAIIDDADFLNEEGANSLLKTLEEPPPSSVLILISTSPLRQLPTIRSRCQLIRFSPLQIDEVETVLRQLQLEVDESQIRRAAQFSHGSVKAALEWLDHDLHEFRDILLQHLESHDVTREQFAKTLTQFVDQEGTDATTRRMRLNRVLELSREFYQSLMVSSSGFVAPEPNESATEIQHAAGWCSDPLRAADCLQTCLNAQAALGANAHIPTLIESWLIELGRVARGEVMTLESFND